MADFSQYKTISSKLKKRFLVRKPNLNEASEQFSALSRELKQFKSYSGYCHLAVARCEHSLGNSNNELMALLEAARLFRDCNEVNAAISAYRHSVLVCDQSILPSVFYELASFYKSKRRFLEAADTLKEGSLFKEAAYCYIDAEKFELAANCFQKCADEELTQEDLITIFLLKLCFCDPKRCDFELPLADVDTDNDELIALNCLLHSLLIIVKEKEDDQQVKSLLFAQLYNRLNNKQRDLLHYIFSQI
ncbi:factor VIII intron 22 protein-like protein [Dinothrombium tinctorium]|uniref:Factor VIII intron 22 protein-like protein n=1 Tax=Dinothrombium tinctorium TaxID=1965070 RepID=A0A443QC62_9ACAR|nr:factor VIII intron 22 protein-like protein [Dinothrombium tinctorium]